MYVACTVKCLDRKRRNDTNKTYWYWPLPSSRGESTETDKSLDLRVHEVVMVQEKCCVSKAEVCRGRIEKTKRKNQNLPVLSVSTFDMRGKDTVLPTTKLPASVVSEGTTMALAVRRRQYLKYLDALGVEVLHSRLNIV